MTSERSDATNEKLIESERRLRSVLESVVDAIITIGERGMIESFNPAAERIFGYSAAEVIDQNVTILMPEPYRSGHDSYLKNYLDTGEKKIIGIGREVQGKRKDGSVFPMDLAVSEVRLSNRRLFTGIIRDISQRKAAEAAIVESERRLSTLIGNLPGAAYRYLLDDNWTFAFISDGCHELCGYPADELMSGSVSWANLIDDEDRYERKSLIQVKIEARLSFQTVYRIQHRNGESRRVLEQGQGVFSAEGVLVAIEGFISDTTELQKAREKLVQSERLAAMGQMLSGIAHESRNALQRIQASVDMLGFEIDAESDAAREVQRISRAREDLQRLFEELRGFAAPIHLETSTVDLSKVWGLAWSHLEASIEDRRAVLSVRANGVNLECRVDTFRVQQVFRNLMENSLAACSDPVKIEIECRDTQIFGRPAISVVVRDNGPGIDVDQDKKVFEAFYTTKTKGTGLGMAIAQRIMDAHGGTIGIVRGEQPGAAFELVFPREGVSQLAAKPG